MRRATACGIAAIFLWTGWMQAAGNSWEKIRYRGGTVVAKVNPFDWNTTLTVTPDDILLVFGPRQKVRIKPSQVTSLSYGKEAHRRVADVVALSAVLGPLALFGLLHVSKDHLVGIVFQADDGKPGAVLLEVHKSDSWTVVQVLKAVTGKPVDMKP